jgi:hypothetical protein
MKKMIVVAISFMFLLIFCEVSNSEVRTKARQMRTLGDSLIATLTSHGLFSGMNCSQIDTLGSSSLWLIRYQYVDNVNYKNSRIYYLKGKDGQISIDSSGSMLVGLFVIYDWWMDSDSAINLAEQKGGALIRKQYPSCFVKASLWGHSMPPFTTEWEIDYVCPDGIRSIHLDAQSGNLITSVASSNHSLPLQAILFANYPNPFNPTTTFSFSLMMPSQTTLKVYDILGKEIYTIVDEYLPAGKYWRRFDGTNLSSGTYYVQLSTGDFSTVRSCILLK